MVVDSNVTLVDEKIDVGKMMANLLPLWINQID
jgi:hypothetical protein